MTSRRDMQARGCLTLVIIATIIIYLFSGTTQDEHVAASDAAFSRPSSSTPSSPSSSSRREIRYGLLNEELRNVVSEYNDRTLDINDQGTVERYCNSLDSLNDGEDGHRNLQLVTGAHELLDTYIKEHNQSTLAQEDNELCQSDRSFVVGTYSCPTQLGARMHEFLNAFAGAVITNRTLIWHYCDRDSCRAQGRMDTCDMMIKRKPWMGSADSITQRLKKGGCAKKNGYIPKYSTKSYRRRLAGLTSKSGGASREPKSVSGSGLVENTLVPASRRYGDGEGLLACCGIDSLSKRVLDFGILERQEMYGLVLPGSHLSPTARKRAAALFAAGANQAYGLLFRYAFDFSSELEAFNARAIKALRAGRESTEDSARGGDVSGQRWGRGRETKRRRLLQSKHSGGKSVGRAPLPPPPTAPSRLPVNYTARYERYGPSDAALKPAKGGLHPSRRAPPSPSSSQGGANSTLTAGDREGPSLRVVENEREEEGGEGPFVLAVHVRHMQGKDTGDRDIGGKELRCVEQMLSLHVPELGLTQGQGLGGASRTAAPPCRVLLASDREATLERLRRDIEALGCEVLVANHQVYRPQEESREAGAAKWTPLSAAGVGGIKYGLAKGDRAGPDKPSPPLDQHAASGPSDHGPLQGSFASLADVHLLSHAHAFIGSADDRVRDRARARPVSLYSSLIAGLISSGKAHLQRREAWERRSPGGARSDNAAWERWLPGCSASSGTYIPPERHSPVRRPDHTNVSVAYDAAAAVAFSQKLDREAKASLSVHRYGPALGSGQYAPSFCASFTWGAKCLSLRRYDDMSPVCRQG